MQLHLVQNRLYILTEKDKDIFYVVVRTIGARNVLKIKEEYQL